MNKKILAIVALGALVLALPGCARRTMGTDIEETEFVPSEQPAFYKTINETKETVAYDNPIHNVNFVDNYDTMWEELSYLIIPSSLTDGINGKIPQEKDGYCLEFTYEEAKDVPMKEISAATILSSDKHVMFNALAYIGEGEQEGTFADILLKKRWVLVDLVSNEDFKYMTGFDRNDKPIYEQLVELYGDPTAVEITYEESVDLWSISMIYKTEDTNVVFLMAGPNNETVALLVEPIVDNATDSTEEEKEQAKEEQENTEGNTENTESGTIDSTEEK